MLQTISSTSYAGKAERVHQRSRPHTGKRANTTGTGRHDKLVEQTEQLEIEDLRRAARVAQRRAADEAAAQRQLAISEQRRAAHEFAGQLALAYAAFLDFRDAANDLFTDHRDREALSLTIRVPKDARSFAKVARTAYKAALAEPRLKKLERIGYDAPILQAGLDNLKALLATREILVHAMSHTASVLVNSTDAEQAVVQTFGRARPARAPKPTPRASVVATE